MVVKVGLQLFQVSVLARLLTPADFGLMAIVVAIILFAQIFTDMGVSNAIIHYQYISQDTLSSLYWLNVLMGACLMLLLMALSEPVSNFYQKPELRLLLMIVSTSFLITALGQQLRVVAEKNFKFKLLAKIEIVVALISTTVVISWAFYSPSVVVLIAGMVISALLSSLLYWLFLAKGWRPRRCFNTKQMKPFFAFGAYAMCDNLLNSVNRQVDVLIGGRMFSTEALGAYSLPRDLTLRLAGVINPVITRVGLPVMAKSQHDIMQLKNIYLQTLRMTASINFPLYLTLMVFAPEIVQLLFGGQWQDSIPLLRIFALWGVMRSIGNPMGSLLYARGRADLSFRWNLSLFILFTPTIWYASNWGATGMASALLAIMVVLYTPGWFFLVKPLCGVGLWEYTLNLLIPLCASIIAAASAYYAVILLDGMFARLALGIPVGGLVYIAVSLLINKQWTGAMRELVFKR